MDLIKAEHKKLWSKKSVQVSVLLCFAYIIIFASILQYQWFNFGSPKDETSIWGKHFDGYDNIRNHQKYAEQFGNLLTDSSFSDMVSNYQNLSESENDLSDWKVVNTWLQTMYPDLERSDTYKIMMQYVDTNQLTGLYDKRQKAIDDFLESFGTSEKETEYLMAMNNKVNTPFSYVWTEGWMTILGNLQDYGIMIAIVLVICLAPLFSGEWHNRTGAMILSMKNGWKKDAIAKIIVGFSFSTELFFIIAIPSVIVQLIYFGTSGFDMPIQCIKMIAVAPMNMLEAEIYEYAHAFMGIMGFAGLVMLISAFSKSEIASIIAGFALLFIPNILSEYLPYQFQLFSDLFPLVGNSAIIFRTNTLNIFGKIVWMPYLQLLIPPLFGIISIPFTVKLWSKRLRI